MTERFDGVTGPPKAFITGASRDIGAATAIALGEMGWEVAVGYNNKPRRAEGVVARINALGTGAVAWAIGGDITVPEDRRKIIDEVGEWSEDQLDVLVLNAAGGWGKPLEYANKINNIAQVALAEGFAPKMTPGGSILYLTSHWAHLYGDIELPPFDYEPVASTKHAGEAALRRMIPELSEREIRLIIVTGGLVTGTFVGDRGVRRFEEFTNMQREMGNIVTAEEMGGRVAEVVANPDLPSGHVEVVGADLGTFLAQSRLVV